MTKELRTSWLRIATALVLIVIPIIEYVADWLPMEQLAIQGILVLCGVGLLIQGITGLVEERRR